MARRRSGGRVLAVGTTVTSIAEYLSLNVALLRWQLDAACRGTDPAAWDNDHKQDVTSTHLRICGSCPVRRTCLEWALEHHETGIWAATTSRERNRIRKRRGEVVRRTHSVAS